MTKIDKLLNLEDETETVIQIGELLWEKSKNDKDFESLNEYEKNVIFIEMLEGQVNNGGFDQYFFNSSGEYAYETLKALEEIKANQTAKILNSAIKTFPTLPVPKDTEQRRELMEDIPDNISETWDKLDDEFYEYPENLAGLVIEYVKTNKKEFE
ncbi:DMP19 family protein [Leeuwenhoekiella parthenopeia]|uniref:DMP19 family protein n=1 Tax=Leeuwenhoekiella parthenopeia TaxID=2890320 RepID=A0ABS8GT68_9FLAO|nr:DMP19 family protein [Leeuwenhoekiella parthenopeia]MCC4213200.1 DMP19 family protein [Leeuwenhoekiella parthenopeia]